MKPETTRSVVDDDSAVAAARRELGSNDKPHDSESIGPTAPESLNDLTGTSSRFVLIVLGCIFVLGVVSATLHFSTRNGLIGNLTKDVVALLVVCVLVVPLFFLNRQLPSSRATRFCLYLFLGCVLLHRILGLTDEVRGLDYVPIVGQGGLLHTASRYALSTTAVCAIVATVYFLLLSLEKSYTQLKSEAKRVKEEIADRKQVEKRETQLGRIVDESLEEIFIFDAKTFRFLEVNRGARENLGYSIQEFSAMTPLDVKPQVTLEQFMEIAAPLLNGERKTVNFETVHRRKDGSLYNVEAHLQLADLDNKPVFVAYVRDITARKEIEQELKVAKEELELRVQERTKELTAANLELNQQIKERERAENKAQQHLTELAHFGRVSTIGEMASGISHELNQPLAAIALESEICVAKMRRGSAVSNGLLLSRLESINDQAHRAGEIIRLLKRFTRRAEPSLSTVDVNELVRDVLQLTDSELQNHSVVTRLELGEGLPEVLLDHVQILQVLLNLVRNAVDAMQQSEPEARFLTIRTEAPADGTITISVSDTGEGIAAGDVEQIFESFYTTKPDGIGLGLAISRSLIEAHGGRLWANPNATVGSTLTLRLPIGEKEPASGT